MNIYLDGNDWSVGYFLDEESYRDSQVCGHMSGMLMDSSSSYGMYFNSVPEGLYRATVPGCDRSVLRENGELSDLYYGRNLERSQWSEGKSWCFRKDFMLPASWGSCTSIRLSFLSAGYHARVFLNEEFLGDGRGMFAPWEFDVSNVIVPGEMNHLVVNFAPAPVAVPNHHWDCAADFASYHTCQMSFGWDWSRHLVPTGIFDHVVLHGTGDVRLHDCLFRTHGNHVELTVEVGATADLSDVPLGIRLSPKGHAGGTIEFTELIQVQDGERSSFTYGFDVPDAQFWYPNGYGAQPLYELSLSVPGDEMTRQVGFRDLRMVRNPHSPEEAYPLTFEINGKRIFARGGNWVPADLVFSDLNEQVYEREVRLAKEGGFNLLRVWGGGLIEHQAFYEACDRHGILVWQEFMHACSRYPSDGVYLAQKRVEGETAIRRMRNHVSMAMYCGGNEVQYYGDRPDNPLYLQYGELVSQLAPGMPYHVSSPDLSRAGERHHGPWCFMDHDFWNKHRRFLASEFGCPGFAEVESLNRFIPAGDPCPHGQHWKYHFTYDTGARSLKVMEEKFALRRGGDRRHYSQASMFMQAETLGYVMEHYRKEYPRSSGCFVWQFNESWPTNAFSIVDYYTMPKMAYYRLARANAPVILVLEEKSWLVKDGQFRGTLYLCNDGEQLEDLTLEATAYDLNGQVLFQKTVTGEGANGVTKMGELEGTLPEAVTGDVLMVRLTIRQGDKICFDNERFYGVPDYQQAFDLPQAQLECHAEVGDGMVAVTVTNQGSMTAMNLRCQLADKDVRDVYWLDNYRAVLPGETRTFRCKVQGKAPEKVELYAWNYPEKIFKVVD